MPELQQLLATSITQLTLLQPDYSGQHLLLPKLFGDAALNLQVPQH
jgi:hypothetical protein